MFVHCRVGRVNVKGNFMRIAICSSIFVILFLYLPALCQDKSLPTKANDAFEELSEGKLTLHFLNALNGEGIADASITIDSVGNMRSDTEGNVSFASPIDNGELKVTFKAKGYVTSKFTIEIMAGTIFFNRFSVSPSLLTGQVRIVLDWDKNPPDLDAHLTKDGAYHISYRNMKASGDGTAKLDHDATNGYGPETITINAIDPDGSYEFFVHDFTDRDAMNSNALSSSKATVKVFSSQGIAEIYHVPEQLVGRFWKVFRIQHGDIVPVNEVSN